MFRIPMQSNRVSRSMGFFTELVPETFDLK